MPLAILPAGFWLRLDEIGPFQSGRPSGIDGCYGRIIRLRQPKLGGISVGSGRLRELLAGFEYNQPGKAEP